MQPLNETMHRPSSNRDVDQDNHQGHPLLTIYNYAFFAHSTLLLIHVKLLL